MIRHDDNGVLLSEPVIPLAIAVISLAVLALLMPAVGFTLLPAARFESTVLTAITLTTIATAADVETAAATSAPSLANYNVEMSLPQFQPERGLDNRLANVRRWITLRVVDCLSQSPLRIRPSPCTRGGSWSFYEKRYFSGTSTRLTARMMISTFGQVFLLENL